jgi:hypothetical protein
MDFAGLVKTMWKFRRPLETVLEVPLKNMIAPKCLAIFLFALPSVHASTVFTILDQYTNDVPTGTTYQKLTHYTQYVDAGSVDASPFVIDMRTPHAGGILFYGSTELNSKEQANTFRLTSTTGLFDFISFNLQGLEGNVDERTATSIPKITISSSTGLSRSFSATVDSFVSGDDVFYSYSFSDSGVKEMNWDGVEWVDFTTEYTKAKTSDFVLETGISAVPEPASAMVGVLLALGFVTHRRPTRTVI